jgi:hypothetical protein
VPFGDIAFDGKELSGRNYAQVGILSDLECSVPGSLAAGARKSTHKGGYGKLRAMDASMNQVKGYFVGPLVEPLRSQSRESGSKCVAWRAAARTIRSLLVLQGQF